MNMPSYKLKEAYGMFFSTLANESRLKIINVLRKKSMNVTEITEETGFEQSMVSHNLKVLEYHGMLFMEKKGKFRYYTVNEKTIKPLLGLIDDHMKEYCCRILKGER